jgi:hypothetical protein
VPRASRHTTRTLDLLPRDADALGFECHTKSLQIRYFCFVKEMSTGRFLRSVDISGTLLDVARAALRNQERPCLQGLPQAADGTRTHDLLHGKQSYIGRPELRFACKSRPQKTGAGLRVCRVSSRFDGVLSTNRQRVDGGAMPIASGSSAGEPRLRVRPVRAVGFAAQRRAPWRACPATRGSSIPPTRRP